MNISAKSDRKKLAVKIITAITAIAGSVILPQLFHIAGAVSGVGSSVGASFLPMHIPVILAGLFGGTAVGLTAGILSPIISFMISGMPSALLLPFMVIELGVYGFVSGMLSKSSMGSFKKLLIVQVSGRIARMVATLISVYALGNAQLTAQSAVTFITAGIFGIILQWGIIPYVSEKLEGLKKRYE